MLGLTPCDVMSQTKKASTSKSAATRSGASSKARTSTAKTTKPAAKKKSTGSSKKASSTKKTTATPSSAKLKGLRNEQARIKQNIKKQEQALRANKAQVQMKMKDLARINSDMSRQQLTIDSINTDLRHINTDINILSAQLDNLNDQLNERKANYVKSVRYMAKQRGIESQLMFVFSAKNLSEMFRRMRFMRQYAAYQRTQGKALQERQAQVNAKRSQLHAVRGEKATLLSKGHQEQQKLIAQKDEQQKLVTSLQSQQKTIQAIIDEQKKKDAELNTQIDKLVAEEVERARQRAIAEAKRKAEAAAAAKKKAEELARKKAEAEARARENARRIAEAKAAEEKAKAEARAAKAAEEKARAEARAVAQAAERRAANERAAERERKARERAEQLAREAEAARIAAERKAAADNERHQRAVAEAKKASDNATMLSSADRMVSGGFEANKGRLPSPIAGGRVVSHFGQHGVEGLPGVVLDNKGINILGSAGAVARSIYDGEVSAVFNVGGSMGVLVRHGAYISVYCNLRSVSVSRGQRVSKGQGLGTVGKDNILQVQLRKERAKLNPEQWLARN